jgi:hypothetical protein
MIARLLNGTYLHILLEKFGYIVKDNELLDFLAIHQIQPGFSILSSRTLVYIVGVSSQAVLSNMKVIVPALRGIGVTVDDQTRKKMESLGIVDFIMSDCVYTFFYF